VKVALTGATGFVGSHLADALRAAGHDVVCLVRSRGRGAALETAGCTLVEGALEDEAALRRLVEGAEVLHHVAGVIAARTTADFERVNRAGTFTLARIARDAGVRRMVYVSSLAVSGPTVPGRPLEEADRDQPVTPYGRSKQAGEEAVRASGVAFTIVRPPAVYGPRDRELLRVFRLVRRGLAPLLGDGSQELSFIHAADLARALMAAGESDKTLGRTYHAAHAETVTQRGFVRAVAEAMGRSVRLLPLPAPVVRGALWSSGLLARVLGRATLLTPEKAEELLAPAWTCSSEALLRDAGWRAEIPMLQGLRATAEWYAAEGWL
jgi:nucleoside-diphosphate-sugar epimerase